MASDDHEYLFLAVPVGQAPEVGAQEQGDDILNQDEDHHGGDVEAEDQKGIKRDGGFNQSAREPGEKGLCH